MKNFFIKLKTWALANKTKSVIIGLIFIVIIYAISRLFIGSAQETQYILSTAQKGTIVSTVSGSGQVEASSQVDLKAENSGKITYIGVKAGQQVTKGKTLFSLDARDAQKAVRNAETDLETAKLELEKFKKGPTNLDVQLLEAKITDAEQSKKDADKSVAQAYKDLLNTSTVATSMMQNDTRTPPTITGTYNKDKEVTININIYSTGAGLYFSASATPADSNITGTGIVNTNIPQPIGDTGLYIKFASSTDSATGWVITLPNKTATNYESNLKAYEDAIDAREKTIRDADLTIAENKQKIADLYQPDALELRSKELVVRQKEDALLDAKLNLSDYYVSAPFDGMIASVSAHVGDIASGVLGTIITQQKIATISLNEVDIAQIKLGQKTTLTFDALEDFTITGEVVEIDSVGTTSSGVVNYKVKIAFDTDSDNIKPGMSVSASIVTNIKQDIITVPISAVKNQSGVSYIEITKEGVPVSEGAQNPVSLLSQPETVEVQTGISNDESIEIISGISEGEKYISRTIKSSSTSKATSSSAPSLFGTPGSGSARSGGIPSGGGNFPR